MEITIRAIGKCKILDCSGKLIFGSAPETLNTALREAVQDGTLKVVLNLRNVHDIDNKGISTIIESFIYVKKLGGSLPLLNLTPKFHKILAITKLLTVFDIFDDEQKALEGCE